MREEGRWVVGGWMSLSSVYIRSLVGRKLMNRKWQKCSLPFGVLRKGWSKEGKKENKAKRSLWSWASKCRNRTQVLESLHMDGMYVQGTSRKILSKHMHCSALSLLTEPLPHPQPWAELQPVKESPTHGWDWLYVVYTAVCQNHFALASSNVVRFFWQPYWIYLKGLITPKKT